METSGQNIWAKNLGKMKYFPKLANTTSCWCFSLILLVCRTLYHTPQSLGEGSSASFLVLFSLSLSAYPRMSEGAKASPFLPLMKPSPKITIDRPRALERTKAWNEDRLAPKPGFEV